jgi:hypothetical protein
MSRNEEVETELDATEEQLAELRRFGVAENELEGLTSADAEEWIDELRSERLAAHRFERE